jgi:excisionase family DNA binding protein
MGKVRDSETEAVEKMVVEGFCNVAEAGTFLSISRAKVYLLMDAGDLAYAKFGRSRRIPRRALHVYAAGCLSR